MRKTKTYPENLRILLKAIQGRNITTAEAMIEEELKLYGGRLNQRRRKGGKKDAHRG